ncbi:MAG: DUF4362 domain-containing protein [Desulfitobacteriaceae bacterium]
MIIKKISIFLTILMCVLILNACSPNVNPQTQSTSNHTHTTIPSPNAVVANPSIGTNAEPEKIIIYNKGRSAVFEKGTTTFERLKGYIYKTISEKSKNDQLKLAIVNGDVSELTKQIAIEFLYVSPVEFRYPDGSKQMITKFLIGSSNKLNTYITAPADKGLYAGNLFMVQTDASYEELLLNTLHNSNSGVTQQVQPQESKVVQGNIVVSQISGKASDIKNLDNFLEAVNSGKQANLKIRQATDEGDPILTTLEYYNGVIRA